jgi:hypothetical protein
MNFYRNRKHVPAAIAGKYGGKNGAYQDQRRRLQGLRPLRVCMPEGHNRAGRRYDKQEGLQPRPLQGFIPMHGLRQLRAHVPGHVH